MKIRNTPGLFAPLALLAQAPAATAQDAPIVLEPSSAWSVAAEPDRCVLVRTFGEGDDKVETNLGRRFPRDRVSFLMIGQHAKVQRIGSALNDPGPSNRIDFRFPENGPKGYYRAVSGDRDGVPLIFSEYLVNTAARDSAGDLTSQQIWEKYGFTVKNFAGTSGLLMEGLKRDLFLSTTTFDKAFAAMEKCQDMLLTHRGLDPEKESTRQTGPIMDRDLFKSLAREIQADYPDRAERDGRGAFVTLILKVDADGAVTNCTAGSTFDNPDLEQAACGIWQTGARYAPALYAQGEPFASYAIQRIIYRM
ncbi:energy transducer TonB [Croceicoccus mobilis]|uniref:TonB C-terminal domain-containing protein n=1 Tax=Croceicoccus mobilis TaxID=1703339 RepID=A0A917DQH7_9SPHN|nr:energy transducer TonB [Croceicoccus mobilis]GGD59567.1 hypothetical protein GCM10010990_06140 [Croceicoccus mobilis]